MRQVALFGVGALLLSSFAASENIVVESLPSVPDGWQIVKKADLSTPIRLRIALEQPNVSNGLFERTLYEISSPGHPSYGQHLSREEVRDLVQPRQESTDAVLDWLKSAGISNHDIEDTGDLISFRATVEKAEQLLNASFATYNYGNSLELKTRTLEYSVPEAIRSHITTIQPTTLFSRTQKHVSEIFKVEQLEDAAALSSQINLAMTNKTEALKICNYLIVPNCLRLLYNVGNYTAKPAAKTMLGVSGFLSEYAKLESLQTFLGKFAEIAMGQTFTYALVNGGQNDQNDTNSDDLEANLDIQYAAALGYNTDIRFYSVGGRGPLIPDLDQPYADQNSNEPYLELFTYLLNMTDAELPTTLTTSYGDNEREIPIAYAQKVCTMIGQLGARGVSVLFSSGDTGPGSACQTNDGNETARFTPTFPGACPYVTSVGGTAAVLPEQAASFSSGGFSDYFPRPAYQDAAVAAYLDILGPERFAGYYNASGRGFPDVAAQANNYRVIEDGALTAVSGTSAAAPAFAGIISLVNNALVARGRRPLGFLNPWLYGVVGPASGLTDVTQGGSRGCGPASQYSGLPTPEIVGAGWNATEGWDPVTGLGTPLFNKLLLLAFLNGSETESSYRREASGSAQVEWE
ncbi:vesicle formation at the endoplasmic reticulum [Pestalotiopsis sp. 9143b]|nr:vesicle formation at the endoplasmic reticulum [Pestalotiopsis sp. 9143b]